MASIPKAKVTNRMQSSHNWVGSLATANDRILSPALDGRYAARREKNGTGTAERSPGTRRKTATVTAIAAAVCRIIAVIEPAIRADAPKYTALANAVAEACAKSTSCGAPGSTTRLAVVAYAPKAAKKAAKNMTAP